MYFVTIQKVSVVESYNIQYVHAQNSTTLTQCFTQMTSDKFIRHHNQNIHSYRHVVSCILGKVNESREQILCVSKHWYTIRVSTPRAVAMSKAHERREHGSPK